MKILASVCLSLISVFVARAQSLQLLHSFTNTAGNPNAPLAEGTDGALYGTTLTGDGTVFRITGTGGPKKAIKFLKAGITAYMKDKDK